MPWPFPFVIGSREVEPWQIVQREYNPWTEFLFNLSFLDECALYFDGKQACFRLRLRLEPFLCLSTDFPPAHVRSHCGQRVCLFPILGWFMKQVLRGADCY